MARSVKEQGYIQFEVKCKNKRTANKVLKELKELFQGTDCLVAIEVAFAEIAPRVQGVFRKNEAVRRKFKNKMHELQLQNKAIEHSDTRSLLEIWAKKMIEQSLNH